MPQAKEHRSNAERQAAYRRRQSAALTALQSAKGLPPLPTIVTIPGWHRWRQVLAQTEQAVRDVYEEMEAYRDDRSDQWLESDKAGAFEERLEAVEALTEQIAECRSQIE